MSPSPLAAAAVIAAAGAAMFMPQQATAINGCGVPFEGNTYVVSTGEHLRNLAALSCNEAYNVRVTADITLTADVNLVAPFGTQGAPFTGTFDGGGHTITGMQITSPTADGFGLFGYTDGATLKNVRFTRATVLGAGQYETGGTLAGNTSGTTISNVHVTDTTLNGANGMGGLVGALTRGSITDSSFRGIVNADGTAGGVVAWAQGDTAGDVSISRVHTEGQVSAGTGMGVAGGVAAVITSMPVAQASSSAVVRGATAGGVVGRLQSGLFIGAVTDSYSTGEVIGAPSPPSAVGGIVGATCAGFPASLVRNYFAGTLQPNGAMSGGIVAKEDMCVFTVGAQATVEGNLWNSDTVGAAGAGSTVGVARTTAQMKELATYTALGWSMVNGWEPAGSSTWGICPQVNEGYPFLQSSALGAGCKAPVVPTAAALTVTLLPSTRRVVSGQQVRIGVRVRNTGETAAASATSCVRLPARLVLVRAPGARRSGGVACFAVGTLGGGAQATRTVTARAVTARRTTVTVTGSAWATGISRVSAAKPARVTVTPRVARARVAG